MKFVHDDDDDVDINEIVAY